MDNPFQDPLRFDRHVPECIMVIFGANGDLTKRKLIPALYRLAYDRHLSTGFSVIGLSRKAISDDAFRDNMRKAVQEFLGEGAFDEEVWNSFAQGLFYVPGDFADKAAYSRLAQRVAEVAKARQVAGNVLFYLAAQPTQYEEIARGLGEAGLNQGDGWRRLVVEKPFGRDLVSARSLSESLHQYFPEFEVWRIDHYLGKETVQNILAFRFGNGIFEPLWNRRYVNHVQITGAESIGVEDRAGYYEQAGALRDMIQNHLLQVMATVAMEPSSSFRPDAVRDERAKLLRSIRVWKCEEVPENAVPGQYGPAQIGGEKVKGYQDEPGVKPGSQTNTYAAVTMLVDNWRWAGVPFYIRTGKRLPKRVSEIAIQFNEAPLQIFNHQDDFRAPNLLILRIQPEEGISLKFVSKRPGAGMTLRPVSMDFNYGSSFGERSPEAYETLLLDAMIGDATLYTRQDMVEASWTVVDAIQKVWDATKFDFPNYPAGSWGPAAADEMLARRGHCWRKP